MPCRKLILWVKLQTAVAFSTGGKTSLQSTPACSPSSWRRGCFVGSGWAGRRGFLRDVSRGVGRCAAGACDVSAICWAGERRGGALRRHHPATSACHRPVVCAQHRRPSPRNVCLPSPAIAHHHPPSPAIAPRLPQRGWAVDIRPPAGKAGCPRPAWATGNGAAGLSLRAKHGNST